MKHACVNARVYARVRVRVRMRRRTLSAPSASASAVMTNGRFAGSLRCVRMYLHARA